MFFKSFNLDHWKNIASLTTWVYSDSVVVLLRVYYPYSHCIFKNFGSLPRKPLMAEMIRGMDPIGWPMYLVLVPSDPSTMRQDAPCDCKEPQFSTDVQKILLIGGGGLSWLARVIHVLLNLIKSCLVLPNSGHVFTRFHHGAGYPFFLFGTHHLHLANILQQSIQSKLRTSTEVGKYVVFRLGVRQILDGFAS